MCDILKRGGITNPLKTVRNLKRKILYIHFRHELETKKHYGVIFQG